LKLNCVFFICAFSQRPKFQLKWVIIIVVKEFLRKKKASLKCFSQNSRLANFNLFVFLSSLIIDENCYRKLACFNQSLKCVILKSAAKRLAESHCTVVNPGPATENVVYSAFEMRFLPLRASPTDNPYYTDILSNKASAIC